MEIKNILPGIYAGLTAGALVILSYACSKNEMDFGTAAGNPPANYAEFSTSPVSTTFNAAVGAPVATATALQWIANFQAANHGEGKEYFISAKSLQLILRDPDCVGISLYFAIDENKQAHVLPIGVNSKGYLMKTAAINTLKGQISWETAQTWIANDPGLIDARFFGKNTFSRLFNTPNCQTIRAICATDDQGKPQLLLGNAAIDYAATSSRTLYRMEDASFPCPPVCPLSE